MNSTKTDLLKPRTLAEVRITAASLHRSALTSDSGADRAFDELSQLLAVDPHRAAPRVVEMALHWCGAGSAGLSLLLADSSGQVGFEWRSVSGAMTRYQGDGAPRDLSPCGRCLDAGMAILLARPELEFTFLARLRPSIFAALYVPVFGCDGRPSGVLWVVQHDPVKRFFEHDVSTLERLAPPRARRPLPGKPRTTNARA